MMQSLLVLAEDNAVFNLRNGILLLVVIAVGVGYMMYRKKQM